MNRRRLAIGAAAIMAVAAIAWWRLGGDGGNGAGRSAGAGAGAAQGHARAADRRPIDVATVARGAIGGTVRDPQGAAIAGAQVCATGRSPRLSDEDVRDPRCAAAGGDGRYRIDGLLPATYTVRASAPHFVPARHMGDRRSPEVRLAAGQQRGGIDVVLRPGGVELTGAVVDVGGGPVEGAWVRAGGHEWSDEPLTHARSGADGSFRVWVAAGSVHVTARADGYADGQQMASAPGRVVVLLTPESVLAGRVIEAGGGAPVAGARVVIGNRDAGFTGEGGPDVYAVGFTGDDGRFRFARLPPGRYKPSARAARGFGQASRSVLLGLGQTVTDVVVELHPAVQVTGRVVTGDRTPCPEGSVGLSDPASQRRASGAVEDGRVAIDGVLPGSYRVHVHCRGFRSEDEYPAVAVSAAAPPEQTWTVRAGGRLVGTVRWSTGAPAPSVGVNARLQGEPSKPGDAWQWARSGDDGGFALDGLPPGSYRVAVDGAGSAREPQVVPVTDGGEARVELVVDEGGGVAGEVVDEGGRPVAGVHVLAFPTSLRPMSDSRAQTGDDGSFTIDRLPAGAYRVTAHRAGGWDELRAPGATDDDARGEKVTVVAGKTARVRLVVQSPSGVIRGRVVDGQGAPITDAFVDAARESDSAAALPGQARHAVRWGWSRDPALTDTDGAFAVRELSPGKYTLRAFRRGGGETLAEGVAVGATVTLTIRRTGSLAGAVRLAGGGAPETMTVSVRDGDSGFARSESFFRSGGQFALHDLPAGKFDVMVDSPEGTGRTEAVLAEGQDLTGVSVSLQPNAVVTGRVVSLADGAPVPGCLIKIEPVQGGSRGGVFFGDQQRLSGADGRFVVENAPSGQVQVLAFPIDWSESGHSIGRRITRVESGRTTDIGDLRLPRMRIRPGEPRGDLGFALKETAADAEPGEEDLTVAVVRPDGPAAAAGLRRGDVIASVDGVDVRGDLVSYHAMAAVAPGTELTLGLESGATARLVAGPPR